MIIGGGDALDDDNYLRISANDLTIIGSGGGGGVLNLSAINNGAGALNSNIGVVLEGENGNDELMGTDGDDVITGLNGRDNLTGGNGFDTFIYTSLKDGVDTIQ